MDKELHKKNVSALNYHIILFDNGVVPGWIPVVMILKDSSLHTGVSAHMRDDEELEMSVDPTFANRDLVPLALLGERSS
jgi:hypothetical protein